MEVRAVSLVQCTRSCELLEHRGVWAAGALTRALTGLVCPLVPEGFLILYQGRRVCCAPRRYKNFFLVTHMGTVCMGLPQLMPLGNFWMARYHSSVIKVMKHCVRIHY